MKKITLVIDKGISNEVTILSVIDFMNGLASKPYLLEKFSLENLDTWTLYNAEPPLTEPPFSKIGTVKIEEI